MPVRCLLTLLYERSPLNAYWVNGSDSSGGCIAYVKRAQGFASVDCSSELPILCTQTAAPFTIGADDPSPPASSVPDAYKTIVSSEDLTITGFRDARTFRFLGIPYAVPPVGALRFEPSQAYNGSNNVSALTTGASCMQPYFGIVVPGPRQSEDCLFLNIFTPSLRAADIPTNKGDDETRPVIFWIHGGAYVSGAASHLGSYDRLGSLGSLASPFLLVGNQTLSDQILALEWVQKYISAFGGDPTRVTIMGESAGAASVGALISSPAAKGLFHAATMESFPLNCSITDEAKYVSCLRALPESAFATDVIVYFSPNQSVYNGQPLSEEVWLPSINATMLLGQLNDLLDNGTLPSPVPIMMGTMEDDGTLFLYDDVSSPFPESDYDNLLFEAFGGDLATTIINSTLFPLNTSDPDTVRNTVSYIITLYTFKCPTLQIARKLPNTTYLFEFRRGLPREGLPTVCTPQSPGRQQVCHEEDLPYVFGTPSLLGQAFNTTADLDLAQLVERSWNAFARTLDPSADSNEWPAFNASAEAAQILAWPASVEVSGGLSEMQEQQCKVFDKFGYVYQHINPLEQQFAWP